MGYTECIGAGDRVLVFLFNGQRLLRTVTPERKVSCGKGEKFSFDGAQLVGKMYDLTYEMLGDGKLRTVSRSELIDLQTDNMSERKRMFGVWRWSVSHI